MAPKDQDDMSKEAVGRRLKLTRKAKGLNQASTARLVVVSPQEWNNWEKGRDRISLEKAVQVCTTTGVDLDWIYRGLISGLPSDLATRIQELQAIDADESEAI